MFQKPSKIFLIKFELKIKIRHDLTFEELDILLALFFVVI